MLRNLDKKIQDAEKNAKGLDRDLTDMEKINEKVKGDVFQSQKLLHNEMNKNQELNSKILNLENVLKYKIYIFFHKINNLIIFSTKTHKRSRDNQMDDAQHELNAIKSENVEIYEENNKLNYDLDALKKHIELINELNNQVNIIFI